MHQMEEMARFTLHVKIVAIIVSGISDRLLIRTGKSCSLCVLQELFFFLNASSIVVK